MLTRTADPGETPHEQTVDCRVPQLLASFIRHARYVPRRARALHPASELPPALERVALDAQMRGREWLAWTDERRHWFVCAELDRDVQRRAGAAALRVFFHDNDGRMAASAIWNRGADGTWRLWDR